MKTDWDDPTIGLLLCETRSEAIVELSFKDVQKPIGVSTYTVTRELPRGLEEEIPSIKGVVEKLRRELDAAAPICQNREKGSELDRSRRCCVAPDLLPRSTLPCSDSSKWWSIRWRPPIRNAITVMRSITSSPLLPATSHPRAALGVARVDGEAISFNSQHPAFGNAEPGGGSSACRHDLVRRGS